MTLTMVVVPYERYLKYKEYIDSKRKVNIKSVLINNSMSSESKIGNNNNSVSSESKIGNNICNDLVSNQVMRDENIEEVKPECERITNSDQRILLDDDILRFIPKSYHHSARMILNHMKRNNMKWDYFGRLILGDECVINTHIVDLIRYTVSSYKSHCSDKNVTDFVKLLMITHCPRTVFAKKYLEVENGFDKKGKKNIE